MDPKFHLGDIVRLNRKYYREGRRYFGSALKYDRNFKQGILAVNDLGEDGFSYRIENIEDAIHESFLEKAKELL